MPIKYQAKDNDQRILTLASNLKTEPELSIAALTHGVVKDMLHQSQYSYAHFDEFVDLAVIVSGLGVLQSNIDFVTKQGTFWDPTQWRLIPRPFLDTQGVAWANALAAWLRQENDPQWGEDLEAEIRRPMTKSLKYLFKTDDSFLSAKQGQNLIGQSQSQWLKMAASKSVSTQIVAVRHLQKDDDAVSSELQKTLVEKLRSTHHGVMINAVSASEQIVDVGDTAIEELQFLTKHREHVVRAKAMCALTRLEQLDEATIETAGDMLGSKMKHEIFAGLMALSSLGSVSDHLVPAINRAFIRSLQVCDYEFVGLFAAAFTRWLDDPREHVEQLLATDSPEYMEIAIEALENVGDQLAGLS